MRWGAGGGAAAQPKPTTPPPAIPITAEPVKRSDITQSASFTGSVSATNQVAVLPQASGRVQTIYVDTGSEVHAGDVVAQLDPSSAQITVQQQQASLMSAEGSLNKILAGAKADDISTAQSQLDSAQARLSSLLAQGRPEDVQSAQDQVAAATARLQALQNQGRPESVQQAQDSLTAAQAKLQALLAEPTQRPDCRRPDGGRKRQGGRPVGRSSRRTRSAPATRPTCSRRRARSIRRRPP